jgi:hypothetical protein
MQSHMNTLRVRRTQSFAMLRTLSLRRGDEMAVNRSTAHVGDSAPGVSSTQDGSRSLAYFVHFVDKVPTRISIMSAKEKARYTAPTIRTVVFVHSPCRPLQNVECVRKR